MCLIAHMPAGKSLPKEVFESANRINPDGIGIMSSRGIEKFYGNKQLKRAKAYAAELATAGLAHAIHFRYATHGSKGLALCHPFKLPNIEAWVMHNGVIGDTAKDANEDASDTLLFVNKLIDAPATSDSLDYWTKICNQIGKQNKGLVMYPDGKFIYLHPDEGKTIDGIWYSNQYSLPMSMRESNGYYTPSRLRPTPTYSGYTGGYRGGYYETNRSASDYGGPFGHMIYWSGQYNCYGFWERGNFQKLKVEKGEIVGTVDLTPDKPITLQEDADRKCPRCMRFKSNPPQGFLLCWCSPSALAEWHARQKVPGPGGPTLDTEEKPAPSKAADPTVCDHGVDNWENCRECITELETDTSSEVQQWLAKRQGINWKLKALQGGEPTDRADEIASTVIYLPRASEK